jgi:hypothetical protein
VRVARRTHSARRARSRPRSARSQRRVRSLRKSREWSAGSRRERRARAARAPATRVCARPIDDVSRKLVNVDKRLTEIDADYPRLDREGGVERLTDSVGILLRRMRSQAADVGKYRRFIRMRSRRSPRIRRARRSCATSSSACRISTPRSPAPERVAPRPRRRSRAARIARARAVETKAQHLARAARRLRHPSSRSSSTSIRAKQS